MSTIIWLVLKTTVHKTSIYNLLLIITLIFRGKRMLNQKLLFCKLDIYIISFISNTMCTGTNNNFAVSFYSQWQQVCHTAVSLPFIVILPNKTAARITVRKMTAGNKIFSMSWLLSGSRHQFAVWLNNKIHILYSLYCVTWQYSTTKSEPITSGITNYIFISLTLV